MRFLAIQAKINTKKKQKRYLDAGVALGPVIKKFPKQEALYNLLALTYQAKGEYDKSIDLLNDALKRSKNNTNFINNIGLGYYRKKDYIKAETYFNKVLELNPRFINTIN